jgi:hypothetical protein
MKLPNTRHYVTWATNSALKFRHESTLNEEHKLLKHSLRNSLNPVIISEAMELSDWHDVGKWTENTKLMSINRLRDGSLLSCMFVAWSLCECHSNLSFYSTSTMFSQRNFSGSGSDASGRWASQVIIKVYTSPQPSLPPQTLASTRQRKPSKYRLNYSLGWNSAPH